MMYNIELNIKEIPVQLIDVMKQVGKNNEFKTFYHGSDHLVFDSDRGLKFSKLISELDQVCKVYNVDYVSLLV